MHNTNAPVISNDPEPGSGKMVTSKSASVRAEERVVGVERALDVLSFFGRSEQATLGVTEIAAELGLSKSVVHRTLAACRSRGFLEFDEGSRRYRLGPEILVLGLSCLDRVDVRSLGHETLADLVAQTGETATLSVRVGWTRVYIDQVTPNRDIKMVVRLGRPFPLHAGASSKALLAFLSDGEQEEYLATGDLSAVTPHTIVDPERLRKELQAIRADGFAVSFSERDSSAGSVAAPVFGHDGSPQGVISVSGPVDRFSSEVDQASRALLDATRELSHRLGYRGHSVRT
jgi:IclR family acetate operon transcriptional repressor